MSEECSIAERVRSAIAPDEREGAIAYLDDRPYGPGRPLVVDRRPVELEAEARVVFVDLEPGANWAHRACFVVLAADAEPRVLAAKLPPFWGDGAEHFTVLWQGDQAPSWAIAVRSEP